MSHATKELLDEKASIDEIVMRFRKSARALKQKLQEHNGPQYQLLVRLKAAFDRQRQNTMQLGFLFKPRRNN